MTRASRRNAAAATCAAVVATCAAVAQATVIDSEAARGDHAHASAAGLAFDPSGIWVRVRATPRQRVTGTWMMQCSAGFAAGASSGHFSGRTTLQRELRLPQRVQDPPFCTVLADAQLADGGRIRVTLRYRSRPRPVRHGP
jgi:hypothetical protein